MDHFVAPAKTEQRFDVGTAFADDARGVAIAVRDQAARDLVAFRDRARSRYRRARTGR